jgi:hypothetical protein
MAGETASFAIDLEYDGGGASEAAADLSALKTKLQEDTRALSEMQRAMKAMQQGSVVDADAFAKLRDEIAVTRQSISQGTQQYVKLGGSFGDVAGRGEELAEAAEGAGGGLKEMIDAAKAGAGPLGGMFERVSLLRNALGSGGLMAGLVAAAAAIVVLAAVAAAAVAHLLAFAAASADAHRSQLLLAQGITQSVAGGKDLDAAISRLGGVVPLTRDELTGMASDLAKTGLTGKALTDALQAAAIKAAKLKWGPDFAKQMLSFEVQSRRLHENFAAIFADVHIESFLAGMQDVLSIFDQSTASGQALHAIASAMLSPIFDQVGGLGPYVKSFFQGMVVGALLISIVVLRVRNALRDAFGGATLGGLDGMRIALYAGAAVLGAIAATVATLALLFAGPIVAVGLLVAALSEAWSLATSLWSAMTGGVSKLLDLDLGSIGAQLVQGLVNGIASGTGLVIDAVRGLGTSAMSTLKGVLGIASPSKEFAKLGGFTASGMAEGIEAGATDVQSAVSAMVSIPAAPASGAAAPGAASVANDNSRGGNTIHIEHLTVGAGQVAADNLAQVKAMLADLLEGATITIGAPLSPEGA